MSEFEELVVTQLVVWRAMKLRNAFRAQHEAADEMPPDDKFMEEAITELKTLRKFVMARLYEEKAVSAET